jgi:Uma2 family endonuclease
MGALKQLELISMSDYLAGEVNAKLRHEYVSGRVFAMARASERHAQICFSLAALLRPALMAQSCRGFIADMKLRVADAVYYPDVMVVCDKSDTDPMIKSAPCLLIEVLSESTARVDRNERWQAYQHIATLQNYLLIEQNLRRIELFRRVGLTWQHESYVGESEIELDCPRGKISLTQIYEDLEFSASASEIQQV